MNRPDFQVADLFREIDPRSGVGWVLILKGVSVICDIDRDKSGLRNMKNQNFQFPSAGTTFPSAGATYPSAGTENAIPERQLPQVACLLDCPFQKLGSRMDAPIFVFNRYNGRAEMNRPDFQVANLFREIDPRRGGGWVLIVKGVSVICDIYRDKSGLRNMKNQILKFPSARTETTILLHKAKIDQLPSISGNKGALPKIRVAHGRPHLST